MAQTASESSVGGLIRNALDDVRDLFREELALARAELRQELSKLTAGAVRFGGAARGSLASHQRQGATLPRRQCLQFCT